MQSLRGIQTTGKKTLTVAVYLRVSTVDQGRRGYSLPEQRKACMEKAKALARMMELESGGPVHLDVFEFADTAGGDLIERPELQRVRDFVKESRPDFFVCLDPDRFSRAAYQAIMIANEIEAAGTRIEFVQHEYQATSEGRLFFTLRVAIAEYEKAKILERTARGKRGKMAAGGIPHGLQIYGYRYVSKAEREMRPREGDSETYTLEPLPAEAAWVQQMFEWVANEGMGSQAIAERLNQLGVPAKHGGPWRRGVVADILRNTTYVGEMRLNRYDFTGLGGQLQLPRERRTRKLTPTIRPVEEWVIVDVPPLVPRGLFERVQEALDGMKRRSSTRVHPGRRGHLLSGLLTCGLCGAPMHYVWNNRINGYLIRCANRYPLVRGLKEPQPACSHPYQKVEPVEQLVWERISTWLTEPEVLQLDLERQVTQPQNEADSWQERMNMLREQLEEAKARQARVLYLVSRGVVHPEVAEVQLGEIKRNIDALEGEIERLQASLAKRQNRERNVERVLSRIRDVAENVLQDLDEMDLAERQTLVRMLVKEVRVQPGATPQVKPFGG